jgi:hypothetical protein
MFLVITDYILYPYGIENFWKKMICRFLPFLSFKACCRKRDSPGNRTAKV